MLLNLDSGQSLAWNQKVGAVLRIGSFSVALEVQSKEYDLIGEIENLYGPYMQKSDDSLTDCQITLKSPSLWHRFLRGEIQVYVNGRTPFQPMPRQLGVPMLESGINWFIGTSTNRFLLLHAAVVERHGRAIVLPGPSGTGKSTLCAALVCRGWRLLSDEFAMIRPDNGLVEPHPRPIGLKNDAIDLIEKFVPDAKFSVRYEGTAKGTIAYMCAPREAIEKADIPARPVLVVFPRYTADVRASLRRLEKAPAFMDLVDQSANYFMMLEDGFETLATLVETCDHYVLSYNAIDEAVALIESVEPVLQDSKHIA